MARPPVDFLSQRVKKGQNSRMAQAINELSDYPIHRCYMGTKTKTTDYVMDPLLDRIILVDASAEGVNVTISLPEAADADYVEYIVVLIHTNGGLNTVTIDTVGDATINGDTSVAGTTQYTSLHVASDGTNYFRTDVFS